jgi:hypothetical protein
MTGRAVGRAGWHCGLVVGIDWTFPTCLLDFPYGSPVTGIDWAAPTCSPALARPAAALSVLSVGWGAPCRHHGAAGLRSAFPVCRHPRTRRSPRPTAAAVAVRHF